MFRHVHFVLFIYKWDEQDKQEKLDKWDKRDKW
jgi:hypothetical protein